MTLAKEPLPSIFFAAGWWILNLILSHYFCLTQLFQISYIFLRHLFWYPRLNLTSEAFNSPTLFVFFWLGDGSPLLPSKGEKKSKNLDNGNILTWGSRLAFLSAAAPKKCITYPWLQNSVCLISLMHRSSLMCHAASGWTHPSLSHVRQHALLHDAKLVTFLRLKRSPSWGWYGGRAFQNIERRWCVERVRRNSRDWILIRRLSAAPAGTSLQSPHARARFAFYFFRARGGWRSDDGERAATPAWSEICRDSPHPKHSRARVHTGLVRAIQARAQERPQKKDDLFCRVVFFSFCLHLLYY